MSTGLAERLTATFEAYESAERKADNVWLEYKFLRATEAAVQRANRAVAEARAAHLAVIEQVRTSRVGAA